MSHGRGGRRQGPTSPRPARPERARRSVMLVAAIVVGLAGCDEPATLTILLDRS